MPRVEVHIVALLPRASDLACLTVAERQRLERMRSRARRIEFAATRARLRQLLGVRLGCSPADVPLVFGEHGKPGLAGRAQPTFNASHSGTHAMIALADADAVGIDIEEARPDRPFDRLVQRFFSEAEVERWQSVEPAARTAAFYELWTAKEAYLKAIGTGLTLSSRAFSIATPELQPGLVEARLETTEYAGDRADAWQFRRLSAPPGYAACLCCGAGEFELHVHDDPGLVARNEAG